MAIFAGTAANDTLVGGVDPDTLDGFGGDDLLQGKQGADTLNGGDGDDTLTGGDGDDLVSGAAGFDYAGYSDAAAGVVVSLAASGPQATGGAGFDTLQAIEGLIGSNFADTLTGDATDNRLLGGHGADTLNGGGGNDTLAGGSGANLIDGGAGFDIVDYSGGDHISIFVDLSLATSQSGVGGDTLANIEGVVGTAYFDSLKAGSGGSSLYGRGGGDALFGAAGDDMLDGGDGNDAFYVGVGRDTVIGGEGQDTLNIVAGASALNVNLTQVWGGGQGSLNGGIVSGVELLGSVDGGSAADVIVVGDGYADRVTLRGYAGADSLVGGGGGDNLSGGDGRDTLDGGAGNDFLSIDRDDALILGGAGVDVVYFENAAFAPSAVTIDFSNLWSGGSGFINAIELRGVERFSELKGSHLADRVVVGAGHVDYGVTIDLGDGDDYASGGQGSDMLTGGSGADTLLGGDGGDILSGGEGVDKLSGGAGNDTFYLADGDEVDGGAGYDTLRFYSGVGGTLDLDLHAVWSGGTGTYNGGTVTNIENIYDVYGGGSNDRIIIGDGVVAQIDYYSFAAREVFFGLIIHGQAGNDVIVGSGGTDKIYGDAGADTLSGGAGNDTVVLDGADVIDGGAGLDTLMVGDWWYRPLGALDIDLRGNWSGAADAAIRNIERLAGIYGSDLADRIIVGDGYAIGAYVSAGEGADSVIGSSGNDRLAGEGGADTLSTGLGDDTLVGGEGNDVLDGGAGQDIAEFSGASTDYSLTGLTGGVWVIKDLRGQAYDQGSDTLRGIETLSFSDGSTISISGAPGEQQGSSGDDNMVGLGNADFIQGFAGNDTLAGGDGQDTLWGGDGNDTIDGGADFDQINGNVGNDTARGGDGDDWVSGGKDQDLIYGDAGFDMVYGNIGNDTCYGGDGADWVRGGQNDDIVDGGAGNDWLSGDRGNDTVTGGTGADTLYFFAGAAIDRVTDFSSAAGDRVLLDKGQAYTLSYTTDGAVIDLGNGDQMILVGVTQASLGDWLVT